MKKLGFGLMRLPVLNGNQEEIDLEQVKEMADLFLENGFAYFDTSFVYHNGQSERALRQAVVERHPRDSFTIATKFPTFAVQTEEQVEGIFAQQLEKLGTEYVDYYLLHTLNRKFYNGADGKGGVVKTCRLFDHARKWRDAGKIRHMGFSFHDSPELLDRILTENPDVEFVQIILNYFDWDSYFIQSKGCYDVIRAHGKQVVVMEPVKGGVLAQVPQSAAERMNSAAPDASPASWAVRYAAGKDGVLTVLSGMSNPAQMRDNVAAMKDFAPLTEREEAMLSDIARNIKESGPVGTADYRKYEPLTYHGVSVAALLDSYNSCMVQPNPGFAGELNYLANELLKRGVTNLKQPFPEETVTLDGADITLKVKEAWDFLIAHSFAL